MNFFCNHNLLEYLKICDDLEIPSFNLCRYKKILGGKDTNKNEIQFISIRFY